MGLVIHAAFLLNFILKNISPKKLIKDGNWYKIAIRKKIQQSQKGAHELAKELGINFKTVIKWRKRDHVSDLPFGSKKIGTVNKVLQI